jgi:hypothetical protein
MAANLSTRICSYSRLGIITINSCIFTITNNCIMIIFFIVSINTIRGSIMISSCRRINNINRSMWNSIIIIIITIQQQSSIRNKGSTNIICIILSSWFGISIIVSRNDFSVIISNKASGSLLLVASPSYLKAVEVASSKLAWQQ